MALINRFQNAWNAFKQRAPAVTGRGSGTRPDRTRYTKGQERTIINSVYTRLALDITSLSILHCKVNSDGGYLSTVDSELNNCLTVEANIDQTGKAFIQDICISMFDEGVVAIVPTLTDDDPTEFNSYKIFSMRAGKIVDWYPKHVRVNLYNEDTGEHEDIILPKSDVGIVENPFYYVMNEQNSTVQRLIQKMNQLDKLDSQSASGKLNLIVSLPYLARSTARKKMVADRMVEMEDQLSNSAHGLLYTDGTEKITQLNRPVENTMLATIEYYQKQLYSQLGLTEEIMAGTADENVMENYYSRTIEPIVTAITSELERKFITRTARTQGQRIKFFRDPFKLAPASKIAEMADKFKRNEVMSTDEVRQKIGLRPIGTDQTTSLRNPNISPADGQEFSTTNGAGVTVAENGGENSGSK